MKPLSLNNLSAWGYIGLFVLFCLPYVGTPALLICAIFVRNSEVRNFARAILILTLISWVALIVLALFGVVNLLDFSDIYNDNGVEVFNQLRAYLYI